MPSASIPSPALVADAIARIAARREALDGLADKGVAMVERLAAGEVVEIAGRKPFSDPARAFAVISRAVRLCLALASRLDEALIALLRGGPIPDLAILAPAQKIPAPEAAPSTPVTEPRARIARAVEAAIEAETGDRESAERRRAYVHDHLIEGENYDALLHQPWRVVVEAICADLGLHPDWDAWDNVAGFEFATEDPPGDEPGASTHRSTFDPMGQEGLGIAREIASRKPDHVPKLEQSPTPIPKSAHPGECRDPDHRSVSER